MKQKIFVILAALFLLYTILFPAQTMKSACEGVNLWFHTVLPALLPFLILSGLLIQSGFLTLAFSPLDPFFRTIFGLSAAGGYALLMGCFCGYPMGAKLTGELYLAGEIDRNEAGYLLTFCSQASPAFLSSVVVLQGLKKGSCLLPVFLILFLSNYVTSLIFRAVFHRFGNYLKKPDSSSKKKMSKQNPAGNLLDTSIMNGFETITRLGGYMILFSILSGIVLSLPGPFHQAAPYLCGLLEITTGIACLANIRLPFVSKACIILVDTAFGGLSVAAQTKCVLRESGLPIFYYFMGKFCCAVLTGIFSLLFFFFF